MPVWPLRTRAIGGSAQGCYCLRSLKSVRAFRKVCVLINNQRHGLNSVGDSDMSRITKYCQNVEYGCPRTCLWQQLLVSSLLKYSVLIYCKHIPLSISLSQERCTPINSALASFRFSFPEFPLCLPPSCLRQWCCCHLRSNDLATLNTGESGWRALENLAPMGPNFCRLGEACLYVYLIDSALLSRKTSSHIDELLMYQLSIRVWRCRRYGGETCIYGDKLCCILEAVEFAEESIPGLFEAKGLQSTGQSIFLPPRWNFLVIILCMNRNPCIYEVHEDAVELSEIVVARQWFISHCFGMHVKRHCMYLSLKFYLQRYQTSVIMHFMP